MPFGTLEAQIEVSLLALHRLVSGRALLWSPAVWYLNLDTWLDVHSALQ